MGSEEGFHRSYKPVHMRVLNNDISLPVPTNQCDGYLKNLTFLEIAGSAMNYMPKWRLNRDDLCSNLRTHEKWKPE